MTARTSLIATHQAVSWFGGQGENGATSATGSRYGTRSRLLRLLTEMGPAAVLLPRSVALQHLAQDVPELPHLPVGQVPREGVSRQP